MRPRTLALLWLVLGIAVWNGFFDLYVSGGAREYLRLHAAFEFGTGPEPSLSSVMAQAQREGAKAASLWAALVVAAGWATVAARWNARPRSVDNAEPRASE